MKKKIVTVLTLMLMLVGCGVSDSQHSDIEETEKYTEMLDSGVNLYLMQMTNKFSSAYTSATTHEEKMKYLNEAITDINLSVYEIEDNYEEGVPPTNELYELADKLNLIIEAEMIDDSSAAYDYSVEAGEIIGKLSREYLDGELPPALKFMIENS